MPLLAPMRPVVSVSRRGSVTSAQTSKRAQDRGYDRADEVNGKCDSEADV